MKINLNYNNKKLKMKKFTNYKIISDQSYLIPEPNSILKFKVKKKKKKQT
jgi:hypothetical protein